MNSSSALATFIVLDPLAKLRINLLMIYYYDIYYIYPTKMNGFYVL